MFVLIVYSDGHIERIKVRSAEDGLALVRQMKRLGYGAQLLHVVQA